ncbi:hypothetical protein IAU60_000138 [Kwoniella sp. DSM 27419]
MAQITNAMSSHPIITPNPWSLRLAQARAELDARLCKRSKRARRIPSPPSQGQAVLGDVVEVTKDGKTGNIIDQTSSPKTTHGDAKDNSVGTTLLADADAHLMVDSLMKLHQEVTLEANDGHNLDKTDYEAAYILLHLATAAGTKAPSKRKRGKKDETESEVESKIVKSVTKTGDDMSVDRVDIEAEKYEGRAQEHKPANKRRRGRSAEKGVDVQPVANAERCLSHLRFDTFLRSGA